MLAWQRLVRGITVEVLEAKTDAEASDYRSAFAWLRRVQQMQDVLAEGFKRFQRKRKED